MHNRKVFVYKDLNYAASKTATTVNSALNPADLRDGAIGIYGIHKAGSTNLNKQVLITDGGSEVAGAVPMASFVGDEIIICMGTATGAAQLSNPIQKPSGLKAAVASKYVAPVLGVWQVGYNGTSGSMNYPGTIIRGDDFSISVTDKNYIVSGFRDPHNKKQLSVGLAAGDSLMVAINKWIAAVALRTDDILIDKNKIKVTHNGTGAAFANTATVAGVNGATTLTTSAAHGVTAGDLISLNGDLYVTVAGTTASTLVLARPYAGATGTVANANTLDITVAPTQMGLELTDNAVGRNLFIGVDGVLSNATSRQSTAPNPGAGTQAQVQALEEEARPRKGTTDMITTYIDRDPIRSVTTYDTYILTVQNSNHSGGDHGSVFKVICYLTLAFVSGVADTNDFAQSDFEDIMTQLFTTFPAISA